MNLVSTRLKEGERLDRSGYINELDNSVRAPLRVATERLFSLHDKCENMDELSDVFMALETVLARWDDLDAFRMGRV